MTTPRLPARTLIALMGGAALLLPVVAATPAAARPELPAVTPDALTQADRLVVDAEATLSTAVEAESRAAAARDASAAAVEAVRRALGDVEADLADTAEALRAADRRAAVAAERHALVTLAAKAAAVARDNDPLVLVGAGAGPAGVVGILGHGLAVEPLATIAEERVRAARAEREAAEQEARELRSSRAELLRDRWQLRGDVVAAEQAHHASTAEADRAAAAQRSTRSASTQTAAEAEELRASITVDTRLVRPATGEVSSHFGSRRHPVTGGVKQHTGTDFQIGDGVAYAAAAGAVVSVDRDPAFGLIVVVAHGSVDDVPVTTAYAHLAQVDVERGQQVAAGQPVGRIGSTGLSTGPHLHFEIRLGDTAVDPAPWLAGS
ncbi:MAG TPA: M23 family metallopeptidase [Jiangellales bacterium]|nr:M23 family metallopeptidase [Jiangellales bacterium]